MSNESLVFKKYYQTIVEQLNEEDIKTFGDLNNDEDRIKFLYKYGNIKIEKKPTEKNFDTAKNEKDKGNVFYSKKDMKNAIKCYSRGILICPQDSVPSKELLAILVANRSAVVYEIEKIDETITDITYALDNVNCPKNIFYKLYIRLGKCFLLKNNKEDAITSFEKARELLPEASLKESVLRDRSKEINEGLEQAQNLEKRKEIKAEPELESTHQLSGNNSHIEFKEDDYQGKFAVAKKDLTVGTVIVKENPFCSVLSAEYHLKNCQNCTRSVKLPFPCPNCPHVVFCSSKCRDDGINNFHERECEIMPNIIESGASVNCSMALRVMTSKNINFFKKFKNYRNLSDNEKAEFQHLNHVYNLCRHEKFRKVEDFLLYTSIAVFLLELLNTANYFDDEKTNTNNLSDDKILIGGLILRFLQILQFNSHEISQLEPEKSNPGESKAVVSVFIGGALYPTLALFNHSCDPSIVRYNNGNEIVVRLIKSAKKGDIIYENYGPLYTAVVKSERHKYLEDRYWFRCKCVPCEENWPLFSDMNPSSFKIPCKTKGCKNYIVVDDDMDPFRKCPSCGAGNTSTILNGLKEIQNVDSFLTSAEERFKKAKYEDALQQFLQIMKIFDSYTVPPFPDYVKVEQRIRTCVMDKGNKLDHFLWS